ncbi:MAG: glutamate 5-kinase [Dehalococcoidales bacterium]|nr:glutamate 5-kinase [Dehalococcoidales bacterium]
MNTKKTTASLPYKRIVVKFGTSLLTGGSDHLNQEIMSSLVGQMSQLHWRGVDQILVSSGAIASGRHKLGISKRQHLRDIPLKQVLASVGQSRLMYAYEQLFGQYDITVAQALLTRADLADRNGYLNTRNTLLALFDLRVICIVNENDVVAVDEIKGAKFGDNDNLSAMVANLVDADLLVILSNIEGLYTADPHHDPAARLIPQVDRIDAKIMRMAHDTTSKQGTGGMITKIEAARLATNSGVTVVIASGTEKDILTRLASGEQIGTHFLPTNTRLESRERWMLSGLCTAGKVLVDDGAALALKKQKSSLLSAGIMEVEGSFDRGEVVDVHDAEGNHIGCGITNYGAADIAKIKGVQSTRIASLLGYDYGSEVIHRNNLVVF